MDRYVRAVPEGHHHGHHHNSVDLRQPPGDSVGDEAQKAEDNHQLLRHLLGVGGHVGGHVRDDI